LCVVERSPSARARASLRSPNGSIMRLSSTVLASALVLVASGARAEKHDRPRPTITATAEGHDLRVVVHDVTEYCSAGAEAEIVRSADTIRIVHERPAHASRCIATQDLTFVVKDVGPGRYTITYERIPAVAPVRAITVASTTAFVR
jgi:hypothetical protein